jgi:cell division protein ZipA
VTTDFEPGLDEFAMSAGERIGYENQLRKPPETSNPAQLGVQTGLFEQLEENTQPAKPGRKSLFSGFSRKSKSGSASKAARLRQEAPDADGTVETVDTMDTLDQVQESAAAPPANEAAAMEPEPSEVIVVNIMARKGYSFAGDDLSPVLISAGLKFGEMNIFHHRLHNENKGPVIFSVANALNPGTFDLNKLDEFSTIGISLFLALPTAINNLEALEQMLTAAQQIRSALDGELKDDNRNVMTAQTIEHYRQRVRDFELRRLKAAGSRA